MRDSPPAGAEVPGSPLAQLRLLTALDALLVAGSVSGAAAALQISTPAASRMLAQLRQLFGDEILIRSGRRMMPTPLAEALRLRVRALAVETEALLTPALLPPADPPPIAASAPSGEAGPTARRGAEPAPPPPPRPERPADPPLAFRAAPLLDGQPSEGHIRARLASIGPQYCGADRMGRYIATIGAGRSRTRPLDAAEAEDAFAILLSGEAEATQIGAFLMLLSYRGITPIELAGLVRASRRGLPAPGQGPADLDWPAYLSPSNRNPPWFLLAAKLLGQQGHRIALHGFGAGLSPYGAVLDALGLDRAASLAEAQRRLRRPGGGCVALELPVIQPQLQALVNLYAAFQSRSPIHLGLQLLDPLGAGVTLMGLPRATLGALHRETAALLGDRRLLTIDSHRDVAQATPHRLMSLTLSGAGGAPQSQSIAPEVAARPGPPPASFSTTDFCQAVWTGQLRNTAAETAVVNTAALALLALEGGAAPDFERARGAARALWQARERQIG